jgi:hypothetical protein
MVIVGLGITILWYIYKIIFALFCFDIRKIYNDNDNINDTNDTSIIDSIVQVNNPFQETKVVSVSSQCTNNDDNIPIAVPL